LIEVKSPKSSTWAEADVGLRRAGGAAGQLHFLAPMGAELLIDDVLLYEPGR
jgi:hypothetical protein